MSAVGEDASTRKIVLSALCAGVLGMMLFGLLAPSYFTRGFPLDDAWIHAVYARSLAREGALAYNPGTPATGATSLLWPVLLAPLQLLSSDAASLVLATKLLGASLHILTTVLLALVLRPAPGARGAQLTSALCVALHPDLIAASLSGMEVALSLAVLMMYLLACRERWPLAQAIAAALVYPARPELVLLVLLAPAGMWLRHDRAAALRSYAWTLAGVAASLALALARNFALSGRALPATYYAKVSSVRAPLLGSLRQGFVELFEQLSLLRSGWLLLALLAAALLLVLRRPTLHERVALLCLALGLLGCAVSFVLIPPLDVRAFYHQRYGLPAVALIVAALPTVCLGALTRFVSERPAALAYAAGAAAVVLVLLVDAPLRFAKLDNDAHNIDDVQVAIGRELASLPAQAVTWTIDAGAVRYFGAGQMVDLMGLNTPEVLSEGAARYLDRMRPQRLALMPDWSRIERATGPLRVRSFRTSTAYTVTSIGRMREQLLFVCPSHVRGALRVRGRSYAFVCGGPPAAE